MKFHNKIIFFIVFLLLGFTSSLFLNSLNFKNKYEFSLFNSIECCDFCFVLNNNLSNTNDYLKMNLYKEQRDIHILETNNKFFIYKKSNEFDLFNNSLYFEMRFIDCGFEEIKKKVNFNVIYSEKVDNKQVFYCNNLSLKKFCLVKSVKINLQIVVYDNVLIIGYPMIYTSF